MYMVYWTIEEGEHHTPHAQAFDTSEMVPAMRFMEDLGVLTAGHLNHYVTETDVFAAHEGLEIICDPLALADYLTLWDRLRPRMPTSATYALRMLLIDSDVRMEEGPLVQTRRFDMGQAVT